NAFTWTFPPRVLDGVSYGLNKGMVGMGSDNSRGVYDNVVVQVLPPQLTLDHYEDFSDGVANLFTGAQTGTWAVNAGRYDGTPPAGDVGWKLVDLGLPHGLHADSYLELEAKVRTGTTGTTGGILFDQYAANDYKFAALDFQGQKVIIGHVDPRHGWVVDASFPKTLAANTDYVLNLTMRGASVTASLNGAFVGTWSFNGVAVDGKLGLLTRNGTPIFDNVRTRTTAPASNGPQNQLAATPTAARPAPGAALDETTLAVFVEEASRRWRATGLTPEQAAALD